MVKLLVGVFRVEERTRRKVVLGGGVKSAFSDNRGGPTHPRSPPGCNFLHNSYLTFSLAALFLSCVFLGCLTEHKTVTRSSLSFAFNNMHWHPDIVRPDKAIILSFDRFGAANKQSSKTDFPS